MPLDPKRMAEILAQAKAAAAQEVEDPSTGKPVQLAKNPLQSMEASLGIAMDDAPMSNPVAQLLPQPESPLPVTALEQGNVVDFSYPGLYELSERILTLDKAIAANHPEFDSLLQTIHRNLDKDEQLLHLLKPDQISTIFKGLKKKTQTVIVEDTVKGASAARNRGLKNLGLEDL